MSDTRMKTESYLIGIINIIVHRVLLGKSCIFLMPVKNIELRKTTLTGISIRCQYHKLHKDDLSKEAEPRFSNQSCPNIMLIFAKQPSN